MTATHISHFGLTQIGQTADSIVFEGSLGACRRMAFAHGLEVEKYEGQTVSIEGGRATMAPASADKFTWCFFKQGGFICKTRDGWSLLLRMETWNQGN